MLKMTQYIGIISLACLLPMIALAGTVVRTGDSVSIAADQTVEEDFYALGSSVAMSGMVRGDMYTAGGSVTVNGTIDADLTIVSGTAQVHAVVADDVRILGGDVVVAESVGGDVFVMGGLLKVLSGAEIAGDIYFYGGEAEINGSVAGSVRGMAEAIRVDGVVGEDVDVVTTQALTLGERANVAGDVVYQSGSELIRAQNAVVAGEVSRNVVSAAPDTVNYQMLVTPLFVIWFAALLLYLFFRRQLPQLVTLSTTEYGRSGLIGFAILFAAPLIIMLALVSVLGLAVGLVGGLAFGLLFILSLVLTGVVIGGFAVKLFAKAATVNLMTVLLGTGLMYGMLFIPVIGPLVVLVAFAITLGALSILAYRALTQTNLP